MKQFLNGFFIAAWIGMYILKQYDAASLAIIALAILNHRNER